MIPIDRLVRSHRKTIALIIHPNGALEVRAPLYATQSQIETVVEKKRAWILERQAAVRANPLPQKHSYLPGETFYFLGKAHRLEWSTNGRALLELDSSGVFRLAQKVQPEARTVFERWYRLQAQQYLPQRTTYLAQRYGFSFARIRISSARTRWGSCSTSGTISFSWRLMMTPPDVIDAVVLHELVHTVEHNHGRDFWSRLQAIVPDYARHDAWLKNHSRELQL